ncbi:unnamed protein product [Bursaphelenchus okinawaensis]|uniref:CRAL-TRIO domain-containing protein n=1 Tax=Bursaphelenchus okinawaensis TaxID=465554 RepID=A0A811LFL1_9BILA|nr:unnamed protein product [Bursaphelenchus okinawaensis]CAG9122040.1 unnamed protein product [Bursaphelenchus okinawaensis]
MAISESDLADIKKLRELVKDDLTPYYDTDFNLLRWLKGHNHNFNEIVPKLRNHLTFRKSHWDLDTAHQKPRDHKIHSHWQAGLGGLAKKTPNTFINIEQSGSNDYWGMLYTYPLNEIMKARVYDLEVMLHEVMELEKKTGEQASIMYIMDLEGLKYDKNLLPLLSGALASISAFMSEHYVEMIHSFVLVNVPHFISFIWNIAKPLLPTRTRNKVVILDSNWREEILEMADPEALPAFWNEEGKEVFKADIKKAVPFPKEGYYTGGPPKDSQICYVKASSVGSIAVEAEKGQKLQWEFSADGNFAYGIYFSEDPKLENVDLMTAVYPRFNKVPGPTYVPLTDFIICPKTGTYRLWFSNQHAWIHTLKIQYKFNATNEE